jgi:magnesium chelatase family protein
MLSTAGGCAVMGITGIPVAVEADLARGLPAFDIVGLPDSTVRESRERVRAAIRNSGYEFPLARITVNLAPAHIKKVGVGLDLPVAISILAASGQVPARNLDCTSFMGELSLDGSLRTVRGILPGCAAARSSGSSCVVVPFENACEAGCVSGLEVVALGTLREVAEYLRSGTVARIVRSRSARRHSLESSAPCDFDQVMGQDAAIRAIQVAVAGGHNLIMVGPPGGGKTLLASCVPSILPAMDEHEALEVTCIQSITGTVSPDGLARKRPFRRPHHSVSPAGMLGGGNPPMPGEVTLAHRGVLYLDEFCEFRPQVIESLRGPMEDGYIMVSRSHGTVSFPSRFMLIASANPCPCGYLGDPERVCVCQGAALMRYRRRLAGPVIDRIDIQIEVPRVRRIDLERPVALFTSSSVRGEVEHARARQGERFCRKGSTNSAMGPRKIESMARLAPGARKLLLDAVDQMALSARAYHRLIKVSRTIADLDGAGNVGDEHVLEALQYRALDSEPQAVLSYG